MDNCVLFDCIRDVKHDFTFEYTIIFFLFLILLFFFVKLYRNIRYVENNGILIVFVGILFLTSICSVVIPKNKRENFENHYYKYNKDTLVGAVYDIRINKRDGWSKYSHDYLQFKIRSHVFNIRRNSVGTTNYNKLCTIIQNNTHLKVVYSDETIFGIILQDCK